MGYSHYWTRTRKNKPEQFTKFAEVCLRIVKNSDMTKKEKTSINIDEYCVELYPVGEGESFWMRPNEDSGKSIKAGFDWCKTGQGSAYDTVVIACLYAASTMLGYLFESDGNRRDLQAGKQLFLMSK